MNPPHSFSGRPALSHVLEQLRCAGFAIHEQEGGRWLVARNGCGAVLQGTAGEPPQLVVPPGLLRGGAVAHLLDKGYQKFWQDGDRELPARAAELKALHEFQRDLRAALGITTLYNEALGTVSSKYVYDRLKGRETPKRRSSFD
ncbi:MAG TPA: hypothetical protein VNN17_08805 [Terriglobia bacterium]|nr:hypothetical protein [Terriglobia bacterium]